MPVTQAALAYERATLCAGGALSPLFPPGTESHIDANFSMTEALLIEGRKAQGPELGVLAQLYSVLSSGALLSDQRDGVRRIIVAGLKHEPETEKLIGRINALDLPELAKYRGQLSARYLLKVVSWHAMVALAASLFAPPVALRILLSRMRTNNTWGTFSSDYDFDVAIYAAGLPFSSPSSVVSLCALWPDGPFPAGYTPGATANQPTINSNATNQGVSMTTATTTPVAAAVAAINPAVKPIINGMLAQAGLAMDIDGIVNEISARAEAESELSRIKSESEKTITDLRQALSAANSAPSTFSIASAATSIPSGKADTVSADSVFPQMAGLKLKVPCFTWDAPHPDVPAVDHDYIFRKEMLLKALRCLARGENFWLQGHTGSGKTTFVEQIAARLQWPVARVAFDNNVDRSELVGRMQLTADGNGGTDSHWLPGILERAISGGYILLCDEMDAGHPNALYTLQPLLEGKPLTLLEDGGRIVPRSPVTRIVATGNTAGNGDASGLYPACRILSAATLDRFQAFIFVPYMTAAEEERLISSAVPGLSKAMLGRLVKFGAELRNAFVKGETPISYSPRRSVAFARAVDDFASMGIKDEKTSLSLAFKEKLYDAAGDDFRQRITEIANNALGGVDPTITLE